MRENALEADRQRRPARTLIPHGNWQALASGSANCYGLGMLSREIHRISALLAALVLAAGLVAHGFGGPDMAVKSTMSAASDMPMSSDMPMPGKCNGCAGNEKGVAPAACSAFCGAVIGLPSVVAVFDAVPIDTLGLSDGPIVTGHADPPDPYPPRPTILS
jgi:hypothetical protein